MTEPANFPRGERIDIGGYRLNLCRTGQGAPPAIFDTGLGGTSLLWARVLPEVGAFTLACALDRAGYGGSDPAPEHLPRTTRSAKPDPHLTLPSAHILHLCCLIDDLIKGLYSKVPRHHFNHRPKTNHCCPYT